jgi:hypothetical protein
VSRGGHRLHSDHGPVTDLDELSKARQDINNLVLIGERSIRHFYDDGQAVFAVTQDELERGIESDPRTVRRLTTTVTCLESMLESPDRPWSKVDRAWAKAALASFTKTALLPQNRESWKSEDAARVYCRVRTLGSLLRLQPDVAAGATKRGPIAKLLHEAWESRDDTRGSFGLREATDDDSLKWKGTAGERQYPPNAYLTYWGLLANAYAGKAAVANPLRLAAVDWLQKDLGFQISFHTTGSHHADPQQLAWSLCGLVRFGNDLLVKTTSTEWALLQAGLSAFFDQQNEVGEWNRGAALFHYPKAGNAYCYIYETLGELLALATTAADAPSAIALQQALRPYLQKILLTVNRVMKTRQLLSPSKPREEAGWSSGHHPHRTSAESWATASVYRFLHAARRLIGTWANEEAKAVLRSRRPLLDQGDLRERGGTWSLGRGSAGAQLSTLYVHPITYTERRNRLGARFMADPDDKIFDDQQARSAMLFGPPGTGKTNLVEAVAGALGWDFIEITPAQFLQEGVDRVSAQADEIFRHVMELNRCVILLDEIDELIRRRGNEAEPLERFFTTTMLPRLAKLWDLGRVLFFANTNGIADVDGAIRRSQRFDTLMMVMPPGYDKKKKIIADEQGYSLQLVENTVTDVLIGDRANTDATTLALGWFALLRFDQLRPLAAAVKSQSPSNDIISPGLLAGLLHPFIKDLAQLDWEGRSNPASAPPDLRKDVGFERRDSRMMMMAKLDGAANSVPSKVVLSTVDGDAYAELPAGTENPEQWALQLGLTLRPDGLLVDPGPG